jgi:hypothetical protein
MRAPDLATFATLSALILSLAGCTKKGPDISHVVKPNPDKGLQTFQSEAHLDAYLKKLAKAQERRNKAMYKSSNSMDGDMAAPTATAEESAGDAGGGESITNTQEAGVDEGGIVKAHGDYLVVLRRGRLFTVKIGADKPEPISLIDVSPPGSTHDSWYDEMLIHDKTIVVVGYSYQAQATELALFDLDDAGKLSYRATHFMKSNDYYSSRNYASRLLGNKLVFYMPYSMITYDYSGGYDYWDGGDTEMVMSLPAVRQATDKPDNWDTIIKSTDIYEPIQELQSPVLHTVVTCDLDKADLDCHAKGIVGPWSRNFYVSKNAVYVWVGTEWDSDGNAKKKPGVVYRMPLDGTDLGALRVYGNPVDQFSFKESSDGHLNVVVRDEGYGDWMWNGERTGGDVALMRVPVAAMNKDVGTVKEAAYTKLTKPKEGWAFQNRFVGDYVLYGTGSSWGYPEEQRDDRVFIHPYAGGDTQAIELAHGVDRIEALGSDAVIVGTDGENLHFTSLDLGARSTIASKFVQKQAAQGELRSHGFFFKPSGEGDGVLGLPVRDFGSAGYEHLYWGSANVMYLKVDDLKFSKLGSLASKDTSQDDRCVVSCVDWYGNARPIFYKGRVFALLGYELVEGKIDNGAITEVGRTNFIASLLPQIAG